MPCTPKFSIENRFNHSDKKEESISNFREAASSVAKEHEEDKSEDQDDQFYFFKMGSAFFN